jgi:hypothetical protein
MITIYKNIFAKEPYYITIDEALNRIKNGKSSAKVNEIRKTQDKEKANELKKNLPSVCFSGKFTERRDECLIQHSGYMVLDFDKLENPKWSKEQMFKHNFVKAAWISPSGNGVKVLVRIADCKKHREHFQALMDDFPNTDKQCINVSRVCYESHDSEILIRTDEKPYLKIKTIKFEKGSESVGKDDTFEHILIWLNNTGSAFVTGERNRYIYKLASACCRFGIAETNTLSLIHNRITYGNSDFSNREIEITVKSAYKNNTFGTAEFKKDVLIDKSTRSEIKIDESVYDVSVKPKDVIYGIDCKADAMALFRNGYEKVLSTGVNELDALFKFKKGELTLLTGIGNYGKSTFMKYLLLIQILKGKKVAVFSPEDAPAHEFYNDFVEMYFGKGCIYGDDKPTEMQYENVYDLITKNIFFIYPKDIAPTPDYIKERFLELIIKEEVEFCMIDPFNQMTNEYNKSGGRSDKYLETLLSDFGRFAKQSEVYFLIIAHPKMLVKGKDGNYPCPDVFDIADGAMWNNKMDNILVYHLPRRQTDENDTTCEFHSKKIRKRKVVGSIGSIQMEYIPRLRRFFFNGTDYISLLLNENKQENLYRMQPNINFYEPQSSNPFGNDISTEQTPF